MLREVATQNFQRAAPLQGRKFTKQKEKKKQKKMQSCHCDVAGGFALLVRALHGSSAVPWCSCPGWFSPLCSQAFPQTYPAPPAQALTAALTPHPSPAFSPFPAAMGCLSRGRNANELVWPNGVRDPCGQRQEHSPAEPSECGQFACTISCRSSGAQSGLESARGGIRTSVVIIGSLAGLPG